MKHTLGPWKVDESIDYEISVIAPWSEKVKPESTQLFGDYRGGVVCTMHYNSGVPTKEQAMANAKLITAAPALLAALHKAVNYTACPNNPEYHFWLNDAMDALIKAE